MFQKVADEGASTPYIARISFGILKLRDAAIDNLLVSSYVVLFSNRLCSFVENIFACAFQCAMKDSLWVLSEIPVSNRPANCPERFEAAIRGFHSSEWQLNYNEEDTFFP
jgi:hypothetical protein